MTKKYTIMVVPDRTSKVRRFRISKGTIWAGLWFLIFLIAACTLGAFHYFSVIDKVEQNKQLVKESLELRSQLVALNEKVTSVQTTLDRVQRFDTKLREITQLHDPKRHLAMGPYELSHNVENPADGVVDPFARAVGESPHRAISLLGKQLDELSVEVEKREASIRQLETYLRGQKARLDSTPSIWPARGWLTSGFGIRSDPYTGKATMHRGIDIANQLGVPVVSPARGVVTYSASIGGFGRVISIDHGYGLRTRFAHLEEMRVKVGDHVNRGDVIGTIGNSGRSTGPHLHYEIEVNGVHENPRNYILED